MRGASALDQWLARHRGVDAFVVWEPVLVRDTAPPPRARLVAHARNYWDAARDVSTALQQSGADPACLSRGSAGDAVVWDAWFDYAPDASTPAQCGRTIIETVDKLRP